MSKLNTAECPAILYDSCLKDFLSNAVANPSKTFVFALSQCKRTNQLFYVVSPLSLVRFSH